MAIPGSDRRTAPLKNTSARRTPTRAISAPPTSTPPRSSALHSLPRRHPRAMPHAVASSSPRIETALMLALQRNSASTAAHYGAQCSRRRCADIAANIAPVVAHVKTGVSHLSRVILASCLRDACVTPAPTLRCKWRACFAMFSPRLRGTRAIVLAYRREYDAIMAPMNRYPLCNGGATATRHAHATRRPALDLELGETSS